MICGKVIYKTQTEASAIIHASHNEPRKSKRIKLKSVYFCADCNGWHVATGEQSGDVRRKKFTEAHHKGEAIRPRRITEYEFLNISNPNKFKIK